MSDINVNINGGPSAQMPAPVTVGEALKKLDRDVAKQALAARVNGREVDLAYTLDAPANGDPIKIEPVLPQTLEGLDVLRTCWRRLCWIYFPERNWESDRRCSKTLAMGSSTM